jgi:hypothetical protein
MLYQQSHVRVPVRVHPGPDRRISPALRSELYPILAELPTRSGDDGQKSASPTYAGHSVTTVFTVQGRCTGNHAPVPDDSPRFRRAAGRARGFRLFAGRRRPAGPAGPRERPDRPRDFPRAARPSVDLRRAAGPPGPAAAGPGDAKAPGIAGGVPGAAAPVARRRRGLT